MLGVAYVRKYNWYCTVKVWPMFWTRNISKAFHCLYFLNNYYIYSNLCSLVRMPLHHNRRSFVMFFLLIGSMYNNVFFYFVLYICIFGCFEIIKDLKFFFINWFTICYTHASFLKITLVFKNVIGTLLGMTCSHPIFTFPGGV